MKFPTLITTSNKSHISNNRLYTHDNNLWTYNTNSLIPVHHWKFCDVDNTNTSTNDSGLIPIQLTKYNGASFGNVGKIQNSVYIDDGDYLKSSYAQNETYTKISYSVWIKKTNTAETNYYSYIYARGNDYIYFAKSEVGAGVYLYSLVINFGGVVESFTINITYFNVWFLLSITIDTVTDEMKWYINGELKQTDTGTYSTVTYTSKEHYIGNDTTPGTDHDLHGYLEDFRIYDRVLNGQEIALIYNQGQGTYQHSILRGFPTTIPPTGHLKFNDSNVNDINDSGISPTDDCAGSGTTTNIIGGLNMKYYYSSSTSQSLYAPFINTCMYGVLFWTRPITHSTSSYIFKSITNMFEIKYISSTQIQIKVNNNLYYNYTILDNIDTHIAIIINISEDKTLIYINGVYVYTINDSTSSCSNNIHFLYEMTGYVSDIRSYGYVLNYNEIKNIYNNGLGTNL